MILEELNKEKIEEALEENMVSKFSYLVDKHPLMKVIKNKYAVIINSNCKTDMFNIICKTKTQDPEFLKWLSKLFIENGYPFAWWIGFNGEPKNLELELKKLHIYCDEDELGMFIVLNKILDQNKKSKLNIIEVTDSENLYDFVRVITTLIPKDSEAIEDFYGNNQKAIFNKNSKLKLFVGYLNNQPVATSVLFSGNGVAGIWDILLCRKHEVKVSALR